MKKSEETRSRILKEFNDQVYMYGYNKTTLKGISEALEISTGHIYYYFKKKDELMLELHADLLGKARQIVDAIPVKDIEPLVKVMLVNYIVLTLWHLREELQRVTLEVVDFPHLCDENSEQYVRLYRKALKEQRFDVSRERVAMAVHDAYAIYWTRVRLERDGRLKPVDPEVLKKHYFKELLRWFGLADWQQAEIYDRMDYIWRLVDIDQIVEKIYEMDAYNYAEVQTEDTEPL